MKTRIQKEAEFHDRAFGDDAVRQAAVKYYSIMDSHRQYYMDFLRRNSPRGAVLEFGCGPRTYSHLSGAKGATVVGIDISPVAIGEYNHNRAQKAAAPGGGCVMNAESLAFRDRTFDLVSGIAILHHLDLDKTYRELARAMKSDAQAIFLEPMGHNALINAYRRLTPKLRTEDEHPLMIGDVNAAKRYFREVRIVPFNMLALGAVPFRNTPLFNPVLKLLRGLDAAVFRIPFMSRYAWTVALIFSKPKAIE
jgi:SAM-dependent methyltransferase